MKAHHAQVLFARVFDISTSILRLCEVEGAEPDALSILDPGSIAALTRNLQEASDLFWYLVVERTSAEEAEFRQAVWAIHYHAESLKVVQALLSNHDFVSELHNALLLQRTINLTENRYFAQLSQKAQEHIVQGRRPYFGQVARPDRAMFRTDSAAAAFYKYLSNQTHSHPLGVHVAFPARWESSLGRSYLLASCLELAARELAVTTLDYAKRMRRCDGKLASHELAWLRQVWLARWDVHGS